MSMIIIENMLENFTCRKKIRIKIPSVMPAI